MQGSGDHHIMGHSNYITKNFTINQICLNQIMFAGKNRGETTGVETIICYSVSQRKLLHFRKAKNSWEFQCNLPTLTAMWPQKC